MQKGSADILHEGNKQDRSLQMNTSDSLIAYNRQLTRYNSLINKLASQYELNVETFNTILAAFPDEHYVEALMGDIHKFQTLQTGFYGHYEKTTEMIRDAIYVTKSTTPGQGPSIGANHMQ
jgi:hypothetical protein